MEVGCELRNRVGVVADRTLGEVAQPEIFLHALAWMGHGHLLGCPTLYPNATEA